MKPRVWPLLVTIALLLVGNVFQQFQLIAMRKMIDNNTKAEMMLTQAVTDVARGVKQDTQSILKLEDVANNHTDSINHIIKAMYTIWKRKP